MAVNKVEVGGEAVIDLTADTVSENNLLLGATAHNAAGEPIEGAVVTVPVDSELSETSENPVQNKVIMAALSEKASTAVATQSADGLMSSSDKTKLDGISTGGGSSGTDIGDIKITACTNAPTGWLVCDGSAVSRETYADLFLAIGTTYGSGDGSTTFNIPNLKGKVVVGIDESDTDFNTAGKTGGEKSHKLTTSEIPSHSHTERYPTSSKSSGIIWANTGNTSGAYTAVASGDTSTGATGGNAAHNNLQPYMALNYIIYTGVTE